MPGAVSQLAGPPYGRRRMDSGVDNKKQRRPWLKWLNRLITVAFIVLVAWLVISRAHSVDWSKVMPVNPAASVRGPSHSQRRGKTPVQIGRASYRARVSPYV